MAYIGNRQVTFSAEVIDADHYTKKDASNLTDENVSSWNARLGINPDTLAKTDASNLTSENITSWRDTLGVLDAHPVGSYYISEVATSPASLFGGTWEQLEDNLTLWSTTKTIEDENTDVESYFVGGDRLNAMLPNITGTFPAKTHSGAVAPTGAFKWTWQDPNVTPSGTNKDQNTTVSFNANSSNSIYGATDTRANAITTVRPPSVAVYMWKRTA